MRALSTAAICTVVTALACSGSSGSVPRAAPSTPAGEGLWHADPPSRMAVHVSKASGVHIEAAAGDWPVRYEPSAWVGSAESTARFEPRSGGHLISEVGCPFQPVSLPTCSSGLGASPVDVAITAEEWKPGAIVAVEGLLRIGPLHPAQESQNAPRYRREVVDLQVCGPRNCVVLASANQESADDFSPYWCVFDNSGLCCGFQYNVSVVARGRVVEGLGPTVEEPLLCATPHNN
ncbi:MAG TPA: hypothetical protein VJN18_20735 [Polyangiaceae bacterium]|nr:hypothetical protein [Polyangiaceae bacterium]